MPRGRPGGEHGDSDDELLVEFSKIPTVHKLESEQDPEETRKALRALASQALAAGASREEILEVLKAATPGVWGSAKNKNQLYDH